MPKAMRINHGREFVNNSLLEWLYSKGMEVHMTAPHSLSQNGITKRMNWTLEDLARAMRLAADLPVFLWEQAITHVAYIRNRAYSSALKTATPYERWHSHCYRLSKQPNCSHGTCSGLGTWRPRCTKGASSRTRRVVPSPSLSLIALVTAPLSGVANPMTPASSTTRASAPVPVPFPQLSPHVPSYRPITPNPCALGQQVTVILSPCALSYCFVSPRVLLPRIIVSAYTIFWDSLLFSGYCLVTGLILGPSPSAYIRWLWVA